MSATGLGCQPMYEILIFFALVFKTSRQFQLVDVRRVELWPDFSMWPVNMGTKVICFLHFVFRNENTRFVGQDRPSVIGFDFLLSLRTGNDPFVETCCCIFNTEGWTNFVKQLITNMIYHLPNSIKLQHVTCLQHRTHESTS